MSTHAVLVPSAIGAIDVDIYNRSVVSGSAVDNGNVMQISGSSTTSGEEEVWVAIQPSSGSPTHCWMAYSGDEIVLTNSQYKGLDPDPRNFVNAAGDVFSAYKPQIGDIIVLTADAFSTTYSAGNTHAHAVADSYKLKWESDGTGTGLIYKFLKTTYISLATGAIDNQRVTAYKLECISI